MSRRTITGGIQMKSIQNPYFVQISSEDPRFFRKFQSNVFGTCYVIEQVIGTYNL